MCLTIYVIDVLVYMKFVSKMYGQINFEISHMAAYVNKSFKIWMEPMATFCNQSSTISNQFLNFFYTANVY